MKTNVTNKHQLLGEGKVVVLEQKKKNTHTQQSLHYGQKSRHSKHKRPSLPVALSNENANAGQGRHLKTPSSAVSQMSTHGNHFSNLIHIHALIFMRPQVMGPGEVQLPAATEA